MFSFQPIRRAAWGDAVCFKSAAQLQSVPSDRSQPAALDVVRDLSGAIQACAIGS